jgi:histidinol-phosphate aminotransferase
VTAATDAAYPLVAGRRAPASYDWEPGSEQMARRLGLEPDQVLRFDLNTAPGSSGSALLALADAPGSVPISEYPPSDYGALLEAAAAAYGVDPSEVTVGAGADEILTLTAAAFLGPGRRAVVPTPTYAMYRIVSEQRGASVTAVPRLGPDAGYALDRPALVTACRGADVLWLCDPNNPTGLPEPEGSLDALIADLAADANSHGLAAPLVVLDEAYAEFMGRTRVAVSPAARPGVLVVRTASKAYGLAGLRVGFGIAPRSTLDLLESFRAPAPVSGVSAAVATATLLDPEGLGENVARIEAERARLAAALDALGLATRPSVTNFILVPFASAEAAGALADALLARGLVVRRYEEGHPLADHLRITVRARHENDRLLAALEELTRLEDLTR